NGKDTLIGGSGHDYINGGNGNDVLTGNLRSDVLTGGNGNDIFVYKTVPDSPYGAASDPVPVASPYALGSLKGWDIITDFVHGNDKIDLSAVPLTGAGAPNALTWLSPQTLTTTDAVAGT